MLFSNNSKQSEQYRKISPIFASRFSMEPMPKYKLSMEPVDPDIAYQIIKDDILDEGNARQNLATFCQTYMEPQAVRLMSECLEKNAIDKSEYPQTAELENRCVNMISHLWNVNQEEKFAGTSTVGSSEACMLGGLAMKFCWKKRVLELGLDINAKKPNLVISSGYQVCWGKFCVYWDIELREVPIDKKNLSLNLDKVMNYVDEYTIGIVGILGITYTGKYDDIAGLNNLVEDYNKQTDYKIYIHVDAASGGMFTPFVHPNLHWDFRLKNVISINTSGHKYGLVYPGIGWILWRDKIYLPKELVFYVSYLGGDMATMAINFSRSASQIIGQYYNFVRYGFEGYKGIHERTRDVALFIAEEVQKTNLFELYNDGNNIPIVCWKIRDDIHKEWTLYDLADRIRMSGWQVPAYHLPNDMSDTIIQRVVVRADLSMQLALLFVADFNRAVDELNHSRILINNNMNKDKGSYGFTH